MPEISVIVPVYNVERYLHQCIDSILAQTYEDFEVILVDDGSTDSSGEVCDYYEIKDDRVRVIHQENGGAAIARNTGLISSSCPLVTFVDSDDFVSKDYLLVLFQNYLVDKPDVVLSGFNRFYTDSDVRPEKGVSASCLNTNEIGRSLYELERCRLFNSQCCKLFKKQIIVQNNLRFISGLSVSEDMIFSLSYLKHCKSLCSIDFVGYYYRQGQKASLSRTVFPYRIYKNSIDTLFRLRKDIINSFTIQDSRYSQFVNQEYFDGTIWSLFPLSFLSCKEERQSIINIFKTFSQNRITGVVAKSFLSKMVFFAISRESVLIMRLICIYCRIRHSVANLIRR